MKRAYKIVVHCNVEDSAEAAFRLRQAANAVEAKLVDNLPFGWLVDASNRKKLGEWRVDRAEKNPTHICEKRNKRNIMAWIDADEQCERRD